MISSEEQLRNFNAWCLKKGISVTEKQHEMVPSQDLSLSCAEVAYAGREPEKLPAQKSKVLELNNGYWTYSIIANTYITGVNLNGLFEQRLGSDIKVKLPVINLLSNPIVQLACLDFDNLNKFNKFKGFDTWKEIEELIFPNMLPSGYLCLTSPSNKRKVLFLVTNCKTSSDVKNWLKKNIAPDILSCADLSESALTKMFINKDMYNKLSEYMVSNPTINQNSSIPFLDYTPLFNTYYRSLEIPETVEYETGKHEWIDYTGDILPNFGVSKIGIKLIRMMLGNPFLAINKIGLSQEWLAKRYGVSQQYISKTITHLIKKGLLVLISHHYQGVCSARYRVSGELLLFAKHLYWVKCGKEWQEAKKNVELLNAPINPGEWNKTLLKAVYSFSTFEGYSAWFETKEGHKEGSRRSQMESIWLAKTNKLKSRKS
jgi:hypothetical protein